MKVAVYFSGIPAKSKNQQKRQLLADFSQGIKAAGDEVIVVDDHHTVSCDLAVIQGWVHSKTGAHLRIRSDAIDRQRKEGKHILVIDSNLLGFLAPDDKDRYLRYSLDGIFPTTGYYFDRDVDINRWDKIKSSYGFDERSWRSNGEHVLICLQRDGGWSMDGKSVPAWLSDVLLGLRRSTDRPILIRPHPGNQEIVRKIRMVDALCKISTSKDIREDLDRAWATVTYNSSPGVASLLWGVPTWVTDPEPARSQAYPLAQTHLADIEHPLYPDRRSLYDRLAQCHFNSAELISGEAWRFMRARLP